MAAAAEMIERFKDSEASLETTQLLIAHFETHYVANKAFGAATAGIEKLSEGALPASSQLAVRLAIEKISGRPEYDKHKQGKEARVECDINGS